MITTADFIRNARLFKGTKWTHGGRLKDHGIDCTGLVILAWNLSGGNLEDKYDYSQFDEFNKLIRILNEVAVNKGDSWRLAVPGDLIIFRGRLMHNHVGICTEPNMFIHCERGGAKQVIEQKLTGDWRGLVHSVYRFKELE